MSTDDLDDDMDAVDDSDLDDLPEDDDDAEAGNAGKKARKSAASEDEDSGASVAAKERERQLLAAQIEAFLARGGKVQEVGDDVLNDPPRKPEAKYGSRPI